MRYLAVSVAALCALASCSRFAKSVSGIDSTIAAELEHTKAIDNHAHPVKTVGRGEEDREFDALPADAVQEPAMPLAARPDNPMFAAAWQDLFGVYEK